MKLARYAYKGLRRYGIIEGEQVQPVRSLTDQTPQGAKVPLADVRLIAPCEPTKIVCAGLNYIDHAQEMGLTPPEEPVIFMKPSTCVIGPNGIIVYPKMSARVDYEAELGVVIGSVARNVSPEEAAEHILGYTCVNDVTARDLQHKDGQWTRAKSFDTFAPIGPWIETELDLANVKVEAYLSGERVQSSTTDKMIFNVFELVSFISQVMTLYPGDVIATGTPPGIGPMAMGEEIEIRIEGIGSLVNTLGRE